MNDEQKNKLLELGIKRTAILAGEESYTFNGDFKKIIYAPNYDNSQMLTSSEKSRYYLSQVDTEIAEFKAENDLV